MPLTEHSLMVWPANGHTFSAPFRTFQTFHWKNPFFIPAVMGRDSISEVERKLFALPTQLGGLGRTKPIEMAELEYTSSQKITTPLVTLILIQQHEITYDTMTDQERAKTEVRQSRQQHQSTHATQLHSRRSRHLQRAVEHCSEKVLLHGYLFCPLRTMVLHYTKAHFVMPCA